MVNWVVSSINSLGGVALLLKNLLIRIIVKATAKKVMVIRSKKGIDGNMPEVHTGRNFNTTDSGIVSKAPAIAARAVVFFQ